MIVRHLKTDEEWPSTLFMGFGGKLLDRDWAWAVEHDGNIVVGLVACPMHGVVFLLRLAATAEAPRMAIRTLLNAFLKEVQGRGCVGYATLIDMKTKNGRSLDKLLGRANGFHWPDPMIMEFGSLVGMERF